jgi:hypothetical protein
VYILKLNLERVVALTDDSGETVNVQSVTEGEALGAEKVSVDIAVNGKVDRNDVVKLAAAYSVAQEAGR